MRECELLSKRFEEVASVEEASVAKEIVSNIFEENDIVSVSIFDCGEWKPIILTSSDGWVLLLDDGIRTFVKTGEKELWTDEICKCELEWEQLAKISKTHTSVECCMVKQF